MSTEAKVLITGGSGYLGSNLVPALLADGFQVTVLDRFKESESSLLACCANPKFHPVRGDCREESVVSPLLSAADYIIPLAGIVGAPLCLRDPNSARTVNVDAIRLLMKLRSPKQRILFPATVSSYGIGEPSKQCSEETPLRPVSLYGITKAESEKVVLDAGNCVSFRLATVFGTSPRMRIDLLVNDFVYRAFTDRAVVVFEGHAKRNYLHVRDVARVMLHAIRNFDSIRDRPYNVGLSDSNLSKLELCAKIQKHLPHFVYVEAPIGEDLDKRDYIVSTDRLGATGFTPGYSLDFGIHELCKAYEMLRNTKYTSG